MARWYYSEQDEIIADINVIPLVDISLVLLIIFMVTANYLTTYLNVKLPETKNAEEKQVQNAFFATIMTHSGHENRSLFLASP
ncbi:MAG: biopolymer transporter ExbD, partial [Candidatus Omnitrophica bacterium]|nr:biopolymer transporter ExbD [Candidatus Omnitrophota bacterium]